MTRRRGFSLVELVISIGSATVLMAGLTACIIISTAAMRPSGVAFEKAGLADIQRQITNDLQLATRFTERTATAVTFHVPDRDGDGNEETIRYAWAGTSGDPLTYEFNGSTAMNLVEGVQSFQFDFATRSIVGNGTPPSIVINTQQFGYESMFVTGSGDVKQRQYAVKVTLPQNGTLKSITAYIDSAGQPYRYAIYTDNAGEPGTLIVESNTETTNSLDWHTIEVADTYLTAGDYWLAISLSHQDQEVFYEGGSGDVRWYDHDAVGNGFELNWNTSTDTAVTIRISIYATYEPD